MTKNITTSTKTAANIVTKAADNRVPQNAKQIEAMLELVSKLNHSTPAQREDKVFMKTLRLGLSKYADHKRVINCRFVQMYMPEILAAGAKPSLPSLKAQPVEVKVEEKPVETKKAEKPAKVAKVEPKALPEGYVLFGGHSVGCFITYAIGRAMSDKTSDAQSRVLVLRVAKYAHEILGIEFGEDVLKVTKAGAKAMAKQVMSQLMKDAAFVASVKACDKHVEKVKADEVVKTEAKIDLLCPKCGSTDVQRNGKGRGKNVQRCFCKSCHKSFQFSK